MSDGASERIPSIPDVSEGFSAVLIDRVTGEPLMTEKPDVIRIDMRLGLLTADYRGRGQVTTLRFPFEMFAEFRLERKER